MNYPPAISAVRQMGLSPISNTCRKSYEQSIKNRNNSIYVFFAGGTRILRTIMAVAIYSNIPGRFGVLNKL
jgi:hypothetical protein